MTYLFNATSCERVKALISMTIYSIQVIYKQSCVKSLFSPHTVKNTLPPIVSRRNCQRRPLVPDRNHTTPDRTEFQALGPWPLLKLI